MDSGKKLNILIVRNTVRKAIDTYRALNDSFTALLVHGRMTTSDKENVLEQIRKAEKKGDDKVVLVSTQVIEAGVDLDFDMLISDATILTSLIQRIGRIGRKDKVRTLPLKVYLVEGYGDGIYSEQQVRATLNLLREIIKKKSQIGWRISGRSEIYNGLISYKWIIEKLYGNIVHYPVDETLLDVLHEIDCYFVSDMAARLQYKLCSFVREEGLITASALTWFGVEKGFSNSHEAFMEAYKSLLALPFDLVKQKWREILKIENGKIAVLLVNGNNLVIRMSRDAYEVLEELTLAEQKPCMVLSKLDKALKAFRREKLLPLAVILRERFYEPGVGLKIEV
jgi:hypothetical protein